MRWPFRRFRVAFEAFQRRQACDEMRALKLAHMTGFYGNTNLDGEKVDRQQVMADVAQSYDNVIARIWNGDTGEDEAEKQIDPDDPFFKAHRRNQAISTQGIELPGEAQVAGSQ